MANQHMGLIMLFVCGILVVDVAGGWVLPLPTFGR